MKKQILTLSLGLLSLGLMAQKSELKAAEKAIKKQDFTNAISILNSIEGELMISGEDKYKSKFYFLKGKALATKKDYKNAAEALNALLSMSKNKYSEEAKPILNQMIQEVSKKAIDQYNNKKDYKNAAKYIESVITQAAEQETEAEETWYILQRAVYFELKDNKKVTAILEQMVRLFNKPEYWLQLAGMYGELEQEDKQLAVMEAAYQQGYVTQKSELMTLSQIYYFNGLRFLSFSDK